MNPGRFRSIQMCGSTILRIKTRLRTTHAKSIDGGIHDELGGSMSHFKMGLMA
ncbi:Uncharacterised protein [Serratia plymuthica]|nr:Uncharacterised protein [Serratia plymuthica]